MILNIEEDFLNVTKNVEVVNAKKKKKIKMTQIFYT